MTNHSKIRKQSGFGHVLLVLLILVVVVVGGAGYMVYSRQQADKTQPAESSQTTQQSAPETKTDETDINNSAEALDLDPVTSGQSDTKELDDLSKDI